MSNPEKLVCSDCGYPLEIGEHAPSCPRIQKNSQSSEETKETNAEHIPDDAEVMAKFEEIIGRKVEAINRKEDEQGRLRSWEVEIGTNLYWYNRSTKDGAITIDLVDLEGGMGGGTIAVCKNGSWELKK